MKTILIFVFTLSILTLSYGQRQINRKVIEKNKISEVSIYKLIPKSKDSVLIEQAFFNENGNAIKKIYFNDDGKIILKYFNEYENNLLVKQTGYDETDKVNTITTYKYNSNKNWTDYVEANADGSIISYKKMNYNKLFQPTQLLIKQKNTDQFDLNITFKHKKEKAFDVEESYNAKGVLGIIKKRQYNKDKKIINYIESKKSGDLQNIIYKYNNAEQLIEKDILLEKSKSVTKKIKYTYDSNDNIIEESVSENDSVNRIEKYYYKKFGT